MTVAEGTESCFYICPIGPADSTTRKRSNQIFQHIINATLAPLNFTVTRADQMDQSGMITSQIIDGLLNSDLVIADLTDHNPNVFYELAVRHAVAKPFIQIIAEGQTVPFDIQGLRTILVDHRDLDSVHEAKLTLTGMVESIRSGKSVETPLTYTLNIQSLAQSDDSEARGIADIIAEIQGLKAIIRGSDSSNSRATVSGEALTETRAYRALLDKMAKDGRLYADDLRFLISLSSSRELRKWASERIATVFGADEPPF
ncbi:hypothetical protein [Amycolatopsis nigrescens]|uniref:hypothetical protein n=1 Tax=Amycolatopsis nigrescens TaxID=381445 RepID=UPI0012F7D181|nr:hypothetical protein [Amycolatopsis nigrescens]